VSASKLDFDDADRARMSELAARNRSGTLDPAEEAELETYCQTGRLLDLLHSKVRISLKKAGGER